MKLNYEKYSQHCMMTLDGNVWHGRIVADSVTGGIPEWYFGFEYDRKLSDIKTSFTHPLRTEWNYVSSNLFRTACCVLQDLSKYASNFG